MDEKGGTMRFFRDISKYRKYTIYATKAELKSEVANSYLNWIWWILQPLCMMLVYVFVAAVVFRKSEPYFPVFVFAGQTLWVFFSRTLKQGVGLIRKNKSIVTKVYVPKHVLLIQMMLVNIFKMLISFGIVAGLFAAYRVPLSWRIIEGIPIIMNVILFSFGISLIAMHLGVYVDDLKNVVDIIIRFLFYFTGIFYSIETRVPAPFNRILLNLNPLAFFIHSFRNCVLYDTEVEWVKMLVWLIIGIILIIVGARLIYKHENDYVKVI